VSRVARFIGKSENSLDEKGRLVVPARFRERLGQKFIVSLAAADPCLVLYAEPEWDEFCRRLEGAPVKDEAFRNVVRHVLANTEMVSCDAQGRLLVPPTLRSEAGIEREVVTVGALTHVEIWNPARFLALRPSKEDAIRVTAELGLY
jgi:MraZ protein